MSVDRNTVVLLTPPGAAAVAVIRLQGPAVGGFLERHLTKPAKLSRSVHADLIDEGDVIDDALVILCDPVTADLNVHGGSWVVQSVLDLARREGFEPLDARQLPLIPEATDAPTPLEQEINAYLPMARTELGVRTLLAQSAQWTRLQERLARNEPGSQEALSAALADQTLEHLLNPPTVAIVGPANAGKSTLANQLFAQERSITADIPGTTRDWVGEIASIEGLPVMLLDTPGLRATHDPIEALAIDRSRRKISRASLVVLVLDATRPLAGEQSELLSLFPDALLVVNKTDVPAAPDLLDLEPIPTVATTGQGVQELRAAIVQYCCGQFPIDPNLPRCWTERQRKAAWSEMQSHPSP